MKIRAADPFEPAAKDLLTASHALMQSLFPPETNHFLSLDALRAPNIDFVVAEQNEQTIGCAALAHMGSYGELKSMYVDEAARGQGVAQALLTYIEDLARSKGLALLRLETGDLLHAAHRLYAAAGYQICGAFGDYPPDGAHSVYMEKPL